MAKGRTAFPVDAINGTLWGADRTVGVNPGLSSSMRSNTTPSASDKSAGYTTKLVSVKAATRGGSKNRHTRAERYCYCDQAYQLLGWPKISFVRPWWRAVMDDPHCQMSGYHAFMKCCLKYMAETAAFSAFSYVTRYRVFNVTGSDWLNKKVRFLQVPTYQVDGQDVEAYQLLRLTTKKKKITYDPLMIDFRLTHEVTTRGEALVTIPALKNNEAMLVDVYSYYKP